MQPQTFIRKHRNFVVSFHSTSPVIIDSPLKQFTGYVLSEDPQFQESWLWIFTSQLDDNQLFQYYNTYYVPDWEQDLLSKYIAQQLLIIISDFMLSRDLFLMCIMIHFLFLFPVIDSNLKLTNRKKGDHYCMEYYVISMIM